MWLGGSLVLLVLAQHYLSRRLYGLGLLLLGNHRRAAWLYFIVLFPGILLHELSHWAAARLLRVPTGKIRLGPKSKRGGLELGSLSTASTDPLRETLIGLAPLIAGSAGILAILYLAWGFRFPPQSEPLFALLAAFRQLDNEVSRPEFWLGWYLIFAISNAMLPSASDRRSWIPVLIFLGALFVFAYLLGLLPQIAEEITTAAIQGLRDLSLILLITLLSDGLALGLIWLLEQAFGRLLGRRVIY